MADNNVKMQSFKLKDSVSGECRRFRLPINSDLYLTLNQQVKTLYKVFTTDNTADNAGELFKLFYFDEDKDRIEVGSQIELEAAIFSFPSLLVLEIERKGEKEKEKETEKECDRGRGGRGGRGCGWKWRQEMEGKTQEERQEMWRQRRIEMLSWKLDRLTQKLKFVDGKIKENGGEEEEKAIFWVIQRAVLVAKKEYVESRIEFVSNNKETSNNNNNNNINNNKWKHMKTRRLTFRLNMITAGIAALNNLPRHHQSTPHWQQKLKNLENKKIRIEGKLAKMEKGEEEKGGCPMGFMWGNPRFAQPHYPPHPTFSHPPPPHPFFAPPLHHPAQPRLHSSPAHPFFGMWMGFDEEKKE